MHKTNIHAFLITVALSLVFAGGCGKSSSTDSGVDEETAASKKCGSGKSCQGTYSILSSDDKEWTGVCEVKQVDSGEWTKIWFVRPMKACGFEWIRAQGSVGSDWAALAGGGAASDFMVEHTGENVYTLRLCEGGGNTNNTGCK